MSEWAIGLLLLGILVVAGYELAAAQPRRRAERLRRRLRAAERQVTCEHQAARRAMNDAAGQSWRNLVEQDRDSA